MNWLSSLEIKTKYIQLCITNLSTMHDYIKSFCNFTLHFSFYIWLKTLVFIIARWQLLECSLITMEGIWYKNCSFTESPLLIIFFVSDSKKTLKIFFFKTLIWKLPIESHIQIHTGTYNSVNRWVGKY